MWSCASRCGADRTHSNFATVTADFAKALTNDHSSMYAEQPSSCNDTHCKRHEQRQYRRGWSFDSRTSVCQLRQVQKGCASRPDSGSSCSFCISPALLDRQR